MSSSQRSISTLAPGACLLLALLFAACGGTISSTDGGAASDAASGGDAAGSDGGAALDGSHGDAGATDAGAYACSNRGGGPSGGVPPEFAGCAQASDCELVSIGCYCGNQPVEGVSTAYLQAAEACEKQHASSCALGCALGVDLQAQDGKTAKAIGDISVRCAPPPDGGAPICQSYVP